MKKKDEVSGPKNCELMGFKKPFFSLVLALSFSDPLQREVLIINQIKMATDLREERIKYSTAVTSNVT